MQRKIDMLLAALCAFGALAAYAEDPAGLEWKGATSPFTFKEYFNGGWASQQYKWLPDRLTNKIATEKTGVTVDRIFPTGKDNDYLNLLIASGDLPDVIQVEWNNPIAQKLIKSGQVYALSDLIDQYAPKFKQMLDPEMVKYHSVDGKLWYLPNYYVTKDARKNGVPDFGGVRPLFVRKDIYAALGSPKLETPDQWVDFLKKAKAKYPDLMPIGMDNFDVTRWGFAGSTSLQSIILAYAPELRGWENNQAFGTFTDKGFQYSFRDPNYVEAFKFVNKLYREGLYDPQLLVYKTEQFEEKFYASQYIAAAAWVSGLYTQYNPAIVKTSGDKVTYAFPGAFAVKGKTPQYPSARLMGWMATFVTKKAANPERIVKYLEYAWSDEGQLDFRYGKEGESYRIVDGLPKVNDDIVALQKSDYNGYTAKYGFEDSTLVWKTGGVWEKVAVRDMKKLWPDEYATYSELAKNAIDSYALGLDSIEPDPSTPEGIVHAKVKEIWNRVLPKMIMAKSDSDFQKAYKDGIAQVDKAGAAKAEQAIFDLHTKDLAKKGVK